MTRIVPQIARILLGLVFVVFAANYFHPFLPPQPMPPEPALAFAGALVGSGLMTFLKVIEIVAGAALLANLAVPLALAVLAPIVVGIVFFHAVLAPAGLPIALGVLALELGLAYAYRAAYRPMLRLRQRASATASDSTSEVSSPRNSLRARPSAPSTSV